MTPSPSPQQVEAMRRWLVGTAGMDPVRVAVLSGSGVVVEISRRYPGGITAFLNDYEERDADG